MGYYTDYELSVNCFNEDVDTVSRLEFEVKKLNVFGYTEKYDEYSISWYGNATWYDYDEDMLLLSSKFPNTLFTLRGHGESYDDIWLNYYKNGSAMYDGIEIVEKAFDESLLTKPKSITEKYSYEE